MDSYLLLVKEGRIINDLDEAVNNDKGNVLLYVMHKLRGCHGDGMLNQ